jgi:hypothetical protein
VTLAEIQTLYSDILNHAGLAPGADAIVDCSDVVEVPTVKELRAAARELRPLLDKGLGPIGVVARGPFIYGVARMFSVFAEAFGGNVGTFKSEDDARDWLVECRSG